MVVKTETCFYSELRIYPGHGRRVARRDGKLLIFINNRVRRHYQNQKKAMDLRWTQVWRRNHKKNKSDKIVAKKTIKKTKTVFKSFSGLTIEDLKARRSEDYKKSLKETAPKEEKPKEKKSRGDKRAQPKAGAFTKVPKYARMNKVNATSK